MSETSTNKNTVAEVQVLCYPNLRDYFAMAALTGIIALNEGDSIDGEAHNAYTYADAMLKAREVKP